MKKILIFSLAYFPHVGGAEVAVKEITERLPDTEFHILTLRFSKSDAPYERMGRAFVHRIGSGSSYLDKILFIPRAALHARTLHREHHFDVLWAMMTYMLFPIVLSGLRMPYVLTLQEGDPFEHVFKRWYLLPFIPLLTHGFKQARAITALSNYLAAWAHEIGYSGKVDIVPNGADIARFTSALPITFGKKQGEVYLVTSSRLVYKNAVDDVIRALPLLPEHIKFLVLGVGPEEKNLRSLARDLGVADRVIFKGYVSHDTLPGYLRACDIFVRPSRVEGFGASFPEAMAAGLPVIATQEGGIADFLFDVVRNPDREPTGWAVDKNSPAQIAKAVEAILSNTAHAKQVVANSRKMVMDRYDWDLIAIQMKKVFLAALRKKVVIATPLYPPEIGGPASYARELELGLPGEGVEVTLVKFSDVRHQPNAVRQLLYAVRVFRASAHADCILALDAVSVGWPSYVANLLRRKPFILKIVGDHVWEQGSQRFRIKGSLDVFPQFSFAWHPYLWFLRVLQFAVVRSADTVIVPSEYLKKLVMRWGVPKERVKVIYNAVPIEAGGVIPEKVRELSRPLVVTAGRLVPWKHVEGVIDAMAALPEGSLVIAGDGPERTNLQHRAHERLAGRALFTGTLSRKDLLAVVQSADVFVLNSSYEGLPHMLIEALAVGTPVIATRAGGNAEVIRDGENGILVQPGDTSALSGALVRLLGDAELRGRFTQRAAESAERFSVERMLAETAALLKAL